MLVPASPGTGTTFTPPTAPCPYCSGGRRDRAGIPIDHDTLSTAQALSCYTCAEDGGDVILAGHDGTVAERAAHIGNYSCGKGKEWRPGGRRDPRHQDITWSHLIELVGTRMTRAGPVTRPGLAAIPFSTLPCGLVWYAPASNC